MKKGGEERRKEGQDRERGIGGKIREASRGKRSEAKIWNGRMIEKENERRGREFNP